MAELRPLERVKTAGGARVLLERYRAAGGRRIRVM
jgi:hypothetical protein